MTEIGKLLRKGTEYVLDEKDELFEVKKAYNEGKKILNYINGKWYELTAGDISGDPRRYRVVEEETT